MTIIRVTPKQCPECQSGADNFHDDKKRCEIVCGNCGLVLTGPEHYVMGEKISYPFGFQYYIYPITNQSYGSYLNELNRSLH